MEFFKNIRRFKKLTLKKITGKEIALFAINRKIRQYYRQGESLGTITDLSLDRKAKNITFQLAKTAEPESITIHGYSIAANQNRAYLLWNKMSFTGPKAEQYQQIFKDIDRIEIPKFAVAMTKSIMERP